MNIIILFLDYLEILSIHKYTLIYRHLSVPLRCSYTVDRLLCIFMTTVVIRNLFKSAKLFNTVLILFIYIPLHIFLHLF